MALIEPTNRIMAKVVLLIARSTPRCREMTRLLSAAMDHPVAWRRKLQMQLHFTVCDYCRRYGVQLKFVRRAARDLPEHVTPVRLSDEAKARIKRALAGASR